MTCPSGGLIPDPFIHVSLKENLFEAETVSFTFAFTLTYHTSPPSLVSAHSNLFTLFPPRRPVQL